MPLRILTLLTACVLCSVSVADWPTWQHDNRRSGASDESINVSQLQLDWTWQSSAPPQTAWYGPAKWDAYAFHRNLPSMRSYDQVFHTIVVGDRVWFGSSADDTLYCLDAETGQTHWSFTTDGPIRLAPTWSDGKIYFGCDDGYARCVDAMTGELIWKFTPTNTNHRLINNGRFIPLQPCRSGVTVADGTAWFANAMLPWEDAWLCCVNAATGKTDGDHHFVKSVPGRTMEGAPALSSEFLIIPQGRVAPRMFDRTTGEDKGEMVKSGGGSVVVVSLDENVFHGPATDSRKGGFRESSGESREVIAGLGRGNALVVDNTTSWMLTDTQIVASNMADRSVLWKQPTDCPCTMIKVGNHLFVGGDGKVAAYAAEDGRLVWSAAATGRVFGLSAANDRLLASTDSGAVHCFSTTTTPSKRLGLDVGKQAAPVATKLELLQPVNDKRLIGHWAFQAAFADGTSIKALRGTGLTLSGPPSFSRLGNHQAIELDGTNQAVMVTPEFRSANIPVKGFTAAAWVRLDQFQEWGGIVGIVQDDGDVERGWLLGYRKDRFSLAVSAKDGLGRLDYVVSKSPFDLERWYHVAGSYDGKTIRLFVDGELQQESTRQAGQLDYPDRAWFEIGAYHDKDEYFRMKGAVHEVRLYDSALSAFEIKQQFLAASNRIPAAADQLELKSGPWLQFTDPSTAVVHWTTTIPQPTYLEYGAAGFDKQYLDTENRIEHTAKLEGLDRQRAYQYRIGTTEGEVPAFTQVYECDTFFNYTTQAASRSRLKIRSPAGLATLFNSEVVPRRGLCLLMGGFSAAQLKALCHRSELRFVMAATDPNVVAELRTSLHTEGLYGNQITVHQVDKVSQLPFVGASANVVLANSISEAGLCEVERMLRPDGGVAVLVDPEFDLPDRYQLQSPEVGLKVGQYIRPRLEGSGDWSHLYGRPDNSAFADEQLGGAKTSGDLQVNWVGRPGPRYQADRSGRKPSPLSMAGRLFLQGLNRIVAVDAFNGTVLWALEIPDLGRFNMPRDSSNWCADRDFLYVVVKHECWKIDAKTGQVLQRMPVSGNVDEEFEWGYVAVNNQRLYGSDVKAKTAWTDFWGGGSEGWYDARTGAVTYPICSDRLFCRNPDDGELVWEYRRGVVLNSTVTIADETMYFVESRSKRVMDSDERRVGDPDLWKHLYLVAIDAKTGSPKWEQPLEPMGSQVVCYLAHAASQLIMVTSADAAYKISSFGESDGHEQWVQTTKWPGGKGDHGKAMMRPAIAGKRIFLRPDVLSLENGKVLPEKMPGGHGCGTYACTADSVFYRAQTVTMWNPEEDQKSTWSRLRPDCWLSTIPAGGMLLSPEGGGGCSCGSWMETSIGFLPKVFDVSDIPATN